MNEGFCSKPDRDVPRIKCGYPLPCPHHTVVIDTTQEAMTISVPLTMRLPSPQARARMQELGVILRQKKA